MLPKFDCTSYQYNSQFYLENQKNFFCINVNKNAKEKLSSGFGVTKIKTDTTRACFPNSWCNQPPPISNRVKIQFFKAFRYLKNLIESKSFQIIRGNFAKILEQQEHREHYIKASIIVNNFKPSHPLKKCKTLQKISFVQKCNILSNNYTSLLTTYKH